MSHKADQLILHFGLAKTGTSALQRALFSQKVALLKHHSVLYPGNNENHFFIQALFSAHPESLVQVQRLNLKSEQSIIKFLDKYRQTILKEIQETRAKRIILSSEYFSGMSVEELRAMAAFLGTLAREIVLFAYVRDPWSFSISFIQQLISSGYLKKEVKLGYATGIIEIFAKFEEAFGKQAVVAPYIQHHAGFNVVEDFCRRFDLTSLATNRQQFKEVNISLKTESACAMLELNQHYPRFDENGNYIPNPVRDWMIEAIRDSPLAVTPIRLSTRTAEQIYQLSRADVKMMEKKYFGGEKLFSNLYRSLDTTRSDDLLSISRFKRKELSAFLFSCMQILSARAFKYHQDLQSLLALLKKDKAAYQALVVELDKVRASLQTSTTELEKVNASLRATTTELDKVISSKQEFSSELAAIKASRQWKVAQFLGRIHKQLAPPGSWREKMIRKLFFTEKTE